VTPAVRLSMRLYTVIDDGGNWVQDWNDRDDIPVGYQATLDVTGKDIANLETNGQEEIEWFFSDLSIVKVGHEGHSHQRRLTVTQPGTIQCWATQDGARSNTVTLHFRR